MTMLFIDFKIDIVVFVYISLPMIGLISIVGSSFLLAYQLNIFKYK
jgi:hypothetical protein